MFKLWKSGFYGATFLALMITARPAGAVTASYDFGPSAGQPTGNASALTTGISLTYPFAAGSALQITTSAGNLFCATGATAGTCGSSTGLSGSTAYGLGVGDGRIDTGETLTFTVQAGYQVKLTSFAVTGFAGTEQLLYSINGGANTVINAPGVNVALDSFSGSNAQFNTLTFGAGNGGNYSLAQITFDVTAPEPATDALIAVALVAASFYRRRNPAV